MARSALPAVGVRLRDSARLVYVAPLPAPSRPAKTGDWVLVALAAGEVPGKVVVPDYQAATDLAGRLLRLLTAEELDRLAALEVAADEARRASQQLADELGLSLRMVYAHYTADGRRLILFYAAGGAVDEEALVRRLAVRRPAGIELRLTRVGERGTAVGGVGRLRRGRDEEQASTLLTALPRLNSLVLTAQGVGRVVRVQVTRQTASVHLLAAGTTIETPLGELQPVGSDS